MEPRLLVFLIISRLCITPAVEGWGDVTLNGTDHHVTRTAVADGELGTARSDVTFDRKPAYINGHDSRSIMRPAAQGPAAGEPKVNMIGSKDVLETQQTTCQVTTEQLVATAQATVTRVLQGLCTSKEMEIRFREIEDLVSTRLNELKGLLVQLDDRMDDYNEALRRGRFQQMETLVKQCDPPTRSNSPSGAERQSVAPTPLENSNNMSGDFVENETEPEEIGPRESEIHKYNSSIYLEPNGHGPHKKIFTYYWRIREMRHRLTELEQRTSIRSPSFYIYPGGYRMYIRSYPREKEANFYIHVGITKGEFDETLKWPFALKLRVHILDQTPNARVFEDIASRTWDPAVLCSEFNWQKPPKGDNYECVGLGLPHDLLHHKKYIFSDNLVVKLTVYLES